MKNKLLLTFAVLFLLGSLAGCSQPEASPETFYVPELVTISSVTELEGKTLTIQAEVEIPDLRNLEKVTLKFDEDSFQAMGQDLVLSQYPELEEGISIDGYRGWRKETPEKSIISLDCADDGFEAGRCRYDDVLRDLNGQDMDGDQHNWDPHYLTQSIPNKVGLSSSEAAEKIAAELEKYSCFTYKPWNVTACNIAENPEFSGYYSAIMQPHMDHWPVYGHGALRVSSHMSAEGLFSFQGIMVLKETGRTKVACEMDLDSAVAQFQQEFVEQANAGASVLVERITPGYKALSEYDGTWTLQSVWVFECKESAYGHDFFYNAIYKMENGKLSIID